MEPGDDRIVTDDAALRHSLQGVGALDAQDAPPDLVALAMRRLPPLPPAAAEQALLGRARRRRSLAFATLALGLALVAVAAWTIVGGPAQPLWGDATVGLGELQLTTALLTKPLLRLVAPDTGLGVALALLLAVACGLACWYLLNQHQREDE